MHRTALAALLLVLWAVSACAGGPSGPAAIVNDEEISKALLEQRVEQTRERYKQEGFEVTDEETLQALREALLAEMIDQLLLVQRGRSQGIDAEHAEVKRQYDALVAQFGGEAGLEEALGSQLLSLQDLTDLLVAEAVLFENVNSRLSEQGVPSEEELEIVYDELRWYMEMPPYSEARAFLIEELQAIRWEELAYLFLAELRDEADIEVLL